MSEQFPESYYDDSDTDSSEDERQERATLRTQQADDGGSSSGSGFGITWYGSANDDLYKVPALAGYPRGTDDALADLVDTFNVVSASARAAGDAADPNDPGAYYREAFLYVDNFESAATALEKGAPASTEVAEAVADVRAWTAAVRASEPQMFVAWDQASEGFLEEGGTTRSDEGEQAESQYSDWSAPDFSSSSSSSEDFSDDEEASDEYSSSSDEVTDDGDVATGPGPQAMAFAVNDGGGWSKFDFPAFADFDLFMQQVDLAGFAEDSGLSAALRAAEQDRTAKYAVSAPQAEGSVFYYDDQQRIRADLKLNVELLESTNAAVLRSLPAGTGMCYFTGSGGQWDDRTIMLSFSPLFDRDVDPALVGLLMLRANGAKRTVNVDANKVGTIRRVKALRDHFEVTRPNSNPYLATAAVELIESVTGRKVKVVG